jgi:hypothetical protein
MRPIAMLGLEPRFKLPCLPLPGLNEPSAPAVSSSAAPCREAPPSTQLARPAVTVAAHHQQLSFRTCRQLTAAQRRPRRRPIGGARTGALTPCSCSQCARRAGASASPSSSTRVASATAAARRNQGSAAVTARADSRVGFQPTSMRLGMASNDAVGRHHQRRLAGVHDGVGAPAPGVSGPVSESWSSVCPSTSRSVYIACCSRLQ